MRSRPRPATVEPDPGPPGVPGRRTVRRRTLAVLALGGAVLTACSAPAPGVPAPPVDSAVLDAADVLTDAQEREIDALIEERNTATDAARVAVLTVEETDGSIEDRAREIATAWEVGDAGADNGVLVLAATGDRELRIESADGVREQFTDDEAERVVEDVLEPAFADERYAEGLAEAVEQIYVYAQGEEPPQEPFDWVLLGWIVGGAGLVGVLVAWWIAADLRRRRRIADEELRAARQRDPDLRLTEEQQKAYRTYRYHHRTDDAVTNPAVWLPLYLANPGLYSGGSGGGAGGSAGGSSFGGGGGFTGGGASGSY
ncbi:TPM domain-containing protein [Kocuria sediminis]|uniref:TPM domain-containing protein n=1 Tax=Kocuria sediminis TaxID=1038857 RepID=A0A6N8GJA3_9MICC|nr:TPM domain-containing protein [Kocuria sediminis]